jgi:hypothetical protein
MTDCARCHSVLEVGDLRCPVCSLAPPITETTELVTSKVLRCKECHATLRYSETHASTVCCFCGAALALELSTDPMEHAEASVPFSVSKRQAAASVKEWLGRRGFFAPGDLAGASRIEQLQPVAWAAWSVSGSAKVSYGTDVSGFGRKAAWGPANGQLDRELELLVPATQGLAIEEVVDLGDYDLSTATTEPLDGVAAEDFGVTRTSARARILEGVRNDALAALSLSLRGHKLRRPKLEVMLTGLRTRRLLLPVWVLAYRYGNEKFRVIVHGQREATVVGRAPISMWKVFAAIAAALAGIAVLLGALALFQKLG